MPVVDGGGDLGQRLSAWLAEQRADEAVASRIRERWLRQEATDEATFAGVLLDLAERELRLVIGGSGGRRHIGSVSAVAADCCAIRTAAGEDVLLAYAAITSIRPTEGGGAATGDRPVALDTTLAECLSLLLAERPRLRMATVGGTTWSGALGAVGRDVVTLVLDGPAGSVAYLPTAALTEVTITR